MDKERDKGTLSRQFVLITSVIALGVIIACLAAGFCVPKSDNAVARGLASLEKKDKAYIEVKNENGSERLKTDSLSRELAEKQTELEDFKKSQDNLDKITESNAALESERDILKDEVSKKQSELERLEAAQREYANKIMTWTSGDYTVGTDIAPGKYSVMGTGSIAVASKGKSKANKLLKADGETFTFSDGDLIHIDGNAKIVPQ